MKTTLDLPDELMREVKLRAVMQRRTVKSLVADLLRQGLVMPAPASAAPLPVGSMVEIGSDGLPTVRCQARAPASRMKAKTLLNLEQAAQSSEDLRCAGLPL